MEELEQFLRQIKRKNLVVIAWNIIDERRDFLSKLGVPIIFTGEYYSDKPKVNYAKAWYKIYTNKLNKNCLPLKFGADVDPNRVGIGHTNKKYTISYVGDKSYGRPYVSFFNSLSGTKIVLTPPYIPENEKVKIYKNSMIVLGATSTNSKKANHVPERIFEALAYGAICLTDSKPAVEQTDRHALYFKDVNTLKSIVKLLLEDREEIKQLREAGFEYIRDKGTWASRALDFIKLAAELYKVNF